MTMRTWRPVGGLVIGLLVSTAIAQELELHAQEVASGVYAVIGDLGPQT